jgi:hypothetical protein
LRLAHTPDNSSGLSTWAAREKGIMTRTEKQKMLAGDLYNAGAPELQADMAAAHEWPLTRLAAEDPEVQKLVAEVRHLIRPRSDLRQPDLVASVRALMSRS